MMNWQPYWGIGFAVMVFALIGWIIYVNRPEYKKYKEATLYNVLWKWQWKGDEIIGLWCYCPQCQHELVCDDENCKVTKNLTEKTTFFICNECGGMEKGRLIGGDRRYAVTVVKRELKRQINSGEYLNAINTN